MTDEVSINILTLNCWGIPCVSKNRVARMTAIAKEFTTDNYDIICLQEVWSVNDFKMIEAMVQEQLPYSHYFYSGVIGSGICILSKFPIKNILFHKWPLNGYVHKIHHGDWFGGKGVGLCRLQVHDMNINMYIAHLHAEYNRHNDEYTAHRVLQAFDTAQFIRMTCGSADSVILADACSTSLSNMGTNVCANNSYTSSKLARKFPEGKRIDHILYKSKNNVKIEVTNFQHPLPKLVPHKNFSYSDHEAIMATLKFSPGESQSANIEVKDSLKEAVNICETSLKYMRRQRIWQTSATTDQDITRTTPYKGHRNP
ncbi:Putative neutral sphingomyelinase [Anthophora plagiata]